MEKLKAAHDAFQAADDEWQAALIAKYGKDAGQMRYLAQGQGLECDTIRKTYEERYKAMRAYMAMQQA